MSHEGDAIGSGVLFLLILTWFIWVLVALEMTRRSMQLQEKHLKELADRTNEALVYQKLSASHLAQIAKFLSGLNIKIEPGQEDIPRSE